MLQAYRGAAAAKAAMEVHGVLLLNEQLARRCSSGARIIERLRPALHPVLCSNFRFKFPPARIPPRSPRSSSNDRHTSYQRRPFAGRHAVQSDLSPTPALHRALQMAAQQNCGLAVFGTNSEANSLVG